MIKYFLETKETSIDICKYAKETSPESVSLIYSGMTQSELDKLKEENENWIDETFSTSVQIKNVLTLAVDMLKSR